MVGSTVPRRQHVDKVGVQDSPPPHNLEAEQAVLGSMLLDGDAIRRVMEMLRPEDFYLDRHRHIFETIIGLFQRGQPADLITVTDRLRDKGQLDDVGGAVYITDLLNSMPTSANVEFYSRIVQRDSIRRSILTGWGEIGHATRNGYDSEELATVASRVATDLQERLLLIHSPLREGGVNESNRITADALADDTTIAAEVNWLPFLRQIGIVARGIVTLLSALAKVGKTSLLVYAVLALLRLLPDLRIVWLTEEPRALWKTRLRRFPDLATSRLVLIFAAGQPWAKVLASLKREEMDLLIIDAVRAVCGIPDKNNQAAVTAAIQPLVFLARAKNWAVILVHHLRKSPAEVGLGHAGSGAFVGHVDVAVEMHRDQHSRTRRVCKAISRFTETPAEWVLELRDGQMHILGEPGLLTATETVRRVEAVLDDQARTFEEISALLEPKPSRGALHGALSTLVREKRAARTGQGKRTRPYRWTRKDSFIHDLSPIRELNESGEELR